MSTNPIDWAQGPWSVQLQTVSRAPYDRLAIEGRVFPNWIISFVKEGDVTTGTGGETRRVRAGDVMLHPPNLPFSEHADRSGTHLWMQASIRCAHQFDLLLMCRIAPVVAVPDPAKFEAAFLKLLAVWNDPNATFRDMKLTSGMLVLLEQIMLGWEKAGRPERSEAYQTTGDRFAGLVGQMSARMAERLGRDELAALVSLNPNYLDRAFRKRYGLTPMQMLRDMRLKRAMQLLERGDDTLESIAEDCGMTDASYLCKQFKKQFGLLPSKYRDAVRKSRAEDLYIGRSERS
ncbi:helix-turn-helix domain-containing protein [Cohnella sp. GCM10027633]|uniref:helix-turn-helix domain-containing protein n=1 Tax=unclassified Cohnella TaxID=2636738 RepID=UPI0036440DC8